MKPRTLILISVFVIVLYPGCAPPGPVGEPEIGMANPASVHCEDQGGRLEIRDEENGQVGYCTFQDGSECEEWAFFNGECQPGSAEKTAPSALSDPFAYCAAVGSIDAPGEPYVGPAVPDQIISGMQAEGLISDDIPADRITSGLFWRCMDGRVWACFVGANLPCMEKADTSEVPGPQMESFCQANPDSDHIPASETGRATVYSWRCKDGVPETIKQVFEADAGGFLADFWYEIEAVSK